MAAPVGSGFFAVGALLAIFTLVLAVLRRYISLRATPSYLSLCVFLGLALPASVVLLVPIDLSSNNFVGDVPSGIWLPSRVVLVSWRIAYWLTFIMTWIILPILGEYVDSGYRTPRDRMMYSLRSNGRYHLVVLGCGLIGLIYIIIQNGFRFTSLKSLLMALAYVWGLVFAIYLMGHGLVAIPRGFWRDVNTGNKLRRIQARAPRIHDRLTDSMTELDDIEYQVKQLQKKKNTVSPDLRDWIEELTEMANLPASRLPAVSHSEGTRSSVPAVVTDRYLADLGRRLNRARHQNARFSDSWIRLVQEAADCQAIINSYASQHLEFRQTAANGAAPVQSPLMTPYLRFHLHVHVLPATRVVLTGIFALASACVVWSEVIKSFFPVLSIVSYTVLWRHDGDHSVSFFNQLMAAAWILYMCSAAFVGITDAKVWGNRALVRRNTYAESAAWYAGQVAKLTVPLAYNFLTFLPRDAQHRTTFYDFLGRLINLTPLGKGFDYFFPIFILFPVSATLFNFYGKVKNVFDAGLQDEDEEDLEGNPGGFGAGGWREGRELIDTELNGPGFLGLSSRGDVGGSSSSTSVGRRTDGGATEPLTGRSTVRASPAHSPRPVERHSRPRAGRSANISDSHVAATEEDDDDENMFTSFAHRVKNTFDTTSKPKWLQGMDPGIKRPKWMGGDDDDVEESAGASSTAARGRPDTGNSSGVGRWFNRATQEGSTLL